VLGVLVGEQCHAIVSPSAKDTAVPVYVPVVLASDIVIVAAVELPFL
jgi:hypothetical protein